MDTTRLIERYLEGSLSEEEKRDVEERAAKDEGFRNLISLHREANEAILDEDFHDLHRKVDAVLKSKTGRDTVANRYAGLMPFIKVAAVFLLFVGSVALFRILLTGSPEERIFNRYYVPYEADIITRSDDSAGSLSQAIINYNQNNYQEAFSLLSQITTADPRNYLAWFYFGITCMQMNDFQKAISSFSAIPDNWNNPYSEHRRWFLALALLHENNTARAESEFRRISNEEGFYSRQSDEILIRLRKL